MQTLVQKFNSQLAEKDCHQIWQDQQTYAWSKSDSPQNDYVIDTPPPTVSGTLHVGHVYSYTQADIIARFFRMLGKNVLYPIGWDDNGLPTERLVEKVKKIRGGSMSRAEFIAVCNAVIPAYEQEFHGLFARLGLSVDWTQEYQTISKESRAISQMSFLDLYDKDLIEQRLEPSLWDPVDRTAIAQAEIEEKAQEGILHYIIFGVEGDLPPIEIATTRPELLAGCGAIMIHPTHPRAQELKGKHAITPLFHMAVPFIEDDKVDPEKGSGMVMCCTFGDITDIAWYKTYGLPLRIVLDSAGKIRSDITFGDGQWQSQDVAKAQSAFDQLKSLKAKAARPEIIKMLDDIGVVSHQEKINQIIPVAERSGAPLEIIVTPQWFIKTLDYKAEILRLGQKISWHPAHMYNRFSTWVEGLKWDWCISRQRHFGVPIPVWLSKREGEVGKVLLPRKDQLPVDPLLDLPDGYQSDEVVPVKDVLDTWATSSVTPSLVSKGVSADYGLENNIFARTTPTGMRPQAHEIIRTWAFYTIVKSMHHHGDIPWQDICISGWCLAKDGAKMSKSKGNVIDPIRLIDENGVDAVRYWTGTSRLGNDTILDPNTLKQGRKLVNKLWNATKFVAFSLEGSDKSNFYDEKIDVEDFRALHPIDQWMIAELVATITAATKHFQSYDYNQALDKIERFFWDIFCDNYLELVKWRISQQGHAAISAQACLDFAMDKILRLFAPFIPYITEVLYQNLNGDDGENGQKLSVHRVGNWPTGFAIDGYNKTHTMLIPEVMSAIRKLKSTMGISIKFGLGGIKISPKNDRISKFQLQQAIALFQADFTATLNVNAIAVEEKRDLSVSHSAETDWLFVWSEEE